MLPPVITKEFVEASRVLLNINEKWILERICDEHPCHVVAPFVCQPITIIINVVVGNTRTFQECISRVSDRTPLPRTSVSNGRPCVGKVQVFVVVSRIVRRIVVSANPPVYVLSEQSLWVVCRPHIRNFIEPEDHIFCQHLRPLESPGMHLHSQTSARGIFCVRMKIILQNVPSVLVVVKYEIGLKVRVLNPVAKESVPSIIPIRRPVRPG